MKFEGGDEDDKIISQAEVALNGDADKVSSSRFMSLLASKDRDYLLSPTGSQVLSLSLSTVEVSRASYHPRHR